MLKRIMTSVFVATCLALLMNCPGSANNFQDPRFSPYIEEFVRFSKLADGPTEAEVKSISVIFGKVGPDEFAVYKVSDNTIVVNEVTWHNMKLPEREELIFHEFGHAMFWHEHQDGTIMQAKGMLGAAYYKKHYSVLLNYHFECYSKKCINEPYNDSKYKETPVTKADILNNEHAVVRFTAAWCGPCKALAPVFDEVAKAYPNVKVYVVDVDENQDVAREFNIKGIPTMIAIRNKAIDKFLVGNQPKPEIEELFK